MVLPKKKSFDFRDTYNRYKKNTVFLGISLYGLNNAYGQCVPLVPTYTDSSPSNPSTCEVQMSPSPTAGNLNPSYPAGNVIRINLGTLSSGGDVNMYKFSTVGETTEDTELYLFNSAGEQLAYNNDASGTKQSTIKYHFPTAVGSSEFLIGSYLIVARKGCQALAEPIRIKLNVTNPSDISPEIIEPNLFCLCKGKSAKLGASISSSAAGEPVLTENNNTWTSSEPTIATIDSATGEINFKNEGIVEISLTNAVSSGCKTTNRYVIRPTKTLLIIHD